MPLAIGTVLENRYRIDALLGAGGMGAVYRAWDQRLDQYVAIKAVMSGYGTGIRSKSMEGTVQDVLMDL